MDAPRRTAIEDATAYIRAHRDGYTDPALRERLAQIGYDDAVIEEAFRAAALPRTPVPRAAADRRWVAYVLVVLAWLAAVTVVIQVMGDRMHTEQYPLYVGITEIAALVMVIALTIVLSLATIVFRYSRALRDGHLVALTLAVVVPAMLMLAIAGTCAPLFKGT